MTTMKKLALILAPILVPALLLALFLLLFDLKSFAESKIRSALKAEGDARVVLKASRGGLLLGSIDSLDITAGELTRFPIRLKEMTLHASGIRVQLMALSKKGVGAVQALDAQGTLVIDEKAFTAFLQGKAPNFTTLEARFTPGMIRLTVTTAIVRASLTGRLVIEEETKINFQLSGKEPADQKGMLAGALNYLNPLVDFEHINLASPAFRSLSEEEKKKWNIRVTRIRVEEGFLTIDFTAVKKP